MNSSSQIYLSQSERVRHKVQELAPGFGGSGSSQLLVGTLRCTGYAVCFIAGYGTEFFIG